MIRGNYYYNRFLSLLFKRELFPIFMSLLVLGISIISLQAQNGKMALENGRTYYIYTCPDAPKVVIHAAEELSKYITQVFKVSCVRQSVSMDRPEMLVLALAKEKIDTKCVFPANIILGEDGYYLSIQKDVIIIGGQNGRGVLYGVYSFLEKYIGCRWYSSEVSFIPKLNKKQLPFIEESYTPIVKWREVFYYDLCDPDIAARLKLNGNTLRKGLTARNRWAIKGGCHAGWGLWCHSLYDVVSPSLYDTHPEYFSEIEGKRIQPCSEGTQLCLTNSDLPHHAINSLSRLIQKLQPETPVWADSSANYWSVSQMDGRGNCTCQKCRTSDLYDGSPSGTMLKFVNQIAERFPHKKIATLAYTYTRKAPLHTKPASNVVIQMCAIEIARQGINFPIATSDIHAAFRKDLVDWGKICNEILVWDYVIQFQNLVSPFPNFSNMQDNINFYTNHNVSAVFCQGNREKGGEFAELRGYLLAKLLWNPQCDMKKEMDDFLTGYYGKAGIYIRQYINDMEQALRNSKAVLSMDGDLEAHRNGYLSKECVKRYKHRFDLAENAVANQPEILKRVRKERMAVMYAQICLEYGTIEERKQLLTQLIQLAEENDIWMFSEVDNRKDQSGNREMFYRKYMSKLNNVPSE